MTFETNISNELDIKEYLVKSGFYLLWSCYMRYSWFNLLYEHGHIEEIPAYVLPYESFYQIISPYYDYIRICDKMYTARRSKCRRIKHRLQLMWKYSKNKHFLFLTFKFSNDCLQNTSAKTRRRYVARYLKSYSDFYVANIDFGELNGREHYHAIVDCEYVNLQFWAKYGNLDYEIVPRLSEDADKLCKYINKITNHATKKTTGSAIYSRNLSYFEKLEEQDLQQKRQNTIDYNNIIDSMFELDDDSDFPF